MGRTFWDTDVLLEGRSVGKDVLWGGRFVFRTFSGRTFCGRTFCRMNVL
jgi:hypothetical protein